MSLQTASRNFVMAVNCSGVSLCWQIFPWHIADGIADEQVDENDRRQEDNEEVQDEDGQDIDKGVVSREQSRKRMNTQVGFARSP